MPYRRLSRKSRRATSGRATSRRATSGRVRKSMKARRRRLRMRHVRTKRTGGGDGDDTGGTSATDKMDVTVYSNYAEPYICTVTTDATIGTLTQQIEETVLSEKTKNLTNFPIHLRKSFPTHKLRKKYPIHLFLFPNKETKLIPSGYAYPNKMLEQSKWENPLKNATSLADCHLTTNILVFCVLTEVPNMSLKKQIEHAEKHDVQFAKKMDLAQTLLECVMLNEAQDTPLLLSLERVKWYPAAGKFYISETDASDKDDASDKEVHEFPPEKLIGVERDNDHVLKLVKAYPNKSTLVKGYSEFENNDDFVNFLRGRLPTSEDPKEALSQRNRWVFGILLFQIFGSTLSTPFEYPGLTEREDSRAAILTMDSLCKCNVAKPSGTDSSEENELKTIYKHIDTLIGSLLAKTPKTRPSFKSIQTNPLLRGYDIWKDMVNTLNTKINPQNTIRGRLGSFVNRKFGSPLTKDEQSRMHDVQNAKLRRDFVNRIHTELTQQEPLSSKAQETLFT
jgi:hypothetical protein